MRIMWAALAAATAVASTAQATDLNAPIDSKPTVGSEIRRGHDAVFTTCDMADILPFDALKYAMCVSRVADENRQKMSNGYEPFSLGAYVGSWISLDMQANDAKFDMSMRTEAARMANSERPVIEQYQKATGLTDEQIGTAINAVPLVRKLLSHVHESVVVAEAATPG